MDVEVRRGPGFQASIEKLRQGPKEIRRSLNKEVRDVTKPAQRKLKAAVLGLASAGAGGGGGGQRGAHLRMRSRKGIIRGSTGLRANIAKGLATKITYGGFRSGIRIRAAPTFLPANQATLIHHTNKGSVRHPVFGDREVWVDQTFSPPGWFDRTLAGESAAMITHINQAANRAVRKLQ